MNYPDMKAHDDISPVEFIKLPEVKKLTGVGTTKLYELVNTGLFPAQVKLGGRSVAWVKSEVLEWAQDQIAMARGQRPGEGNSSASAASR